jgi:Protein kinase domain/Autophagy-related protein 11
LLRAQKKILFMHFELLTATNQKKKKKTSTTDLLMSTEGLETATLKISDFGFARALAESAVTDTLCGSPLYMAPEILRGETYTAKADLWSVGSIFYEMLTGSPPFPVRTIVELIQRQQATQGQPIPIPDWLRAAVDPGCVRLLERLLEKNPNKRISWAEFFRDEWLGMAKVVAQSIATRRLASPIAERRSADIDRAAAAAASSSAVADDSNAVPTLAAASMATDSVVVADVAAAAEAAEAADDSLLAGRLRALEADLQAERQLRERLAQQYAEAKDRAASLALQLARSGATGGAAAGAGAGAGAATSSDERFMDALNDIAHMVREVPGIALDAPTGAATTDSPSATVRTVKELVSTVRTFQERARTLEEEIALLRSQATSKICIGDLQVGDLAMFTPNEAGTYTAFCTSATPFVLSHEAKPGFDAEAKSNSVIFGRVVMLMPARADSSNVYKLPNGTDFVEVFLSRDEAIHPPMLSSQAGSSTSFFN